MEFLRFGSSIPGAYWGCCACCIIQNFNKSPDTKTSIQLVDGDSGTPIFKNGKQAFAGPTYRDIFLQRIRFGTFSGRDMPNHAFFAILTEGQIRGNAKAWLPILKEAGFEFIRTVDNSVYTGQELAKPNNKGTSHKNYIFGLFRNIGMGQIEDPFTPPKEWTDLPSVVPEVWEDVAKMGDIAELTASINEAQLKIWKASTPPPLLTEEEVVAAGAPVIMAGLRSKFPQQPKSNRETALAAAGKTEGAATGSPFDDVCDDDCAYDDYVSYEDTVYE